MVVHVESAAIVCFIRVKVSGVQSQLAAIAVNSAACGCPVVLESRTGVRKRGIYQGNACSLVGVVVVQELIVLRSNHGGRVLDEERAALVVNS